MMGLKFLKKLWDTPEVIILASYMLVGFVAGILQFHGLSVFCGLVVIATILDCPRHKRHEQKGGEPRPSKEWDECQS